MADTIIPGTDNPLAWDRYAYTLNNPLKFNDPSGHFVNIAIGALIGATVNVGLYMINEVGRQDGFNWQNDGADLLIAAAQGAVVGGLIGSGVGASAGVTLAMSAGLGAASNLVGDQVGNLITGEDYNAATTTINATTGGISGALTMSGGRVANLIDGGLQSGSYILDSLVTNEQISLEGLAGSFASGYIGQAASSGVASDSMKPVYEEYGTGVWTMTSKGLSWQEAEIWANTGLPAFLSAGESIYGMWYEVYKEAQTE